MAIGHTNYKPTEYETILLAAGWICIEDIDPEYSEYLKAAPDKSELWDYETWQSERTRWNELNATMEQLFPDNYYPAWGDKDYHRLVGLHRQLLDEMMYIECSLGY